MLPILHYIRGANQLDTLLLNSHLKSLRKSSLDFNFSFAPRSYEYELVGQGEKETPLQKFQRLQCEITELAEEINQLKVKFIIVFLIQFA
jgi:hypothetical protein